jgi:hypothetical protein
MGQLIIHIAELSTYVVIMISFIFAPIGCVLAILIMDKADPYWSANPKLEGDSFYERIGRMYKYGFYLILKKRTLKPVPITIKILMTTSFLTNVIALVFILYYAALK